MRTCPMLRENAGGEEFQQTLLDIEQTIIDIKNESKSSEHAIEHLIVAGGFNESATPDFF